MQNGLMVILMSGLKILCVSILLISALLTILQKQIIFQAPASKWNDCSFIPPSWKPYEHSFEGKAVRGWIHEPSHSDMRVFVFHGNAGKACHRTYWKRVLSLTNAEVILVEYPGYDGSPLSYENFLTRGLDTFDYFQHKSNKKVLVVGESLGSAPATYLAAHRKIHALILHASFPSLTEVARSKFPFLPVKHILRFPFPAAQWAEKVSAPALSLHGDQDSVIPYKLGKKQSENFARLQFLKIEGAGHNDWVRYLTVDHTSTLKDFVDRYSREE